MNNRPAHEFRNGFTRAVIPPLGEAVTTIKTSYAPTAAVPRIRPPQLSNRLPDGGVKSLTGSLRTTRPKGMPELPPMLEVPKNRAVIAENQQPKMRRSAAGNMYATKHQVHHHHATKQPSTTPGPSNGLRRGTPLLPLHQTHVYAKTGKGLPPMVHKVPPVKHHGHGRTHNTHRKPLSSMNVLLPPHNAHSATGSAMDSQMFPRPSMSPHPNEFSTFNVEVKPFIDCKIFQNPPLKAENILAAGKNLDEKFDAMKTFLPETKQETVTSEMTGDTLQHSEKENNFGRVFFDEGKNVEIKPKQPIHDVPDKTEIKSEKCNNFQEFKLAGVRNINELQHERNVKMAKSHERTNCNTVKNVKIPENKSAYTENLWRTEFVEMKNSKRQTTPSTIKPSSSNFSSISMKSSGRSRQIKSQPEIENPRGSSDSQSFLTELAFLQQLKEYAYPKNPQNPHTACNFTYVATITETDLLKAAFKESSKRRTGRSPKKPNSEQGISEELKPSIINEEEDVC